MKRHYMIISTVCILFISVFYVSYRTYAGKGRHYYEETGQVVWDINTDERIVALTFDDGPHRKYTAEVLDLLAKYDAKATFFILGENAEKNPELVLREYDEGNELANQTYTHPEKTSISNLEKELKKTNETIYGITGFYPTLFRLWVGNTHIV